MNQELERFEPAEAAGRLAYEHLHRYALCRERAAGQRVLDVACGAGYGTNILAEVAAEAVGLDLDAGTIRRAAKKYKRDNLRFVAADCTDLPFEAGSFDLVVANEMIEHIAEQDAFLSEAKRVLRPGGLLLVSTPNKPIYNRYKSPNPFHVAEMTIPQFRRLLKRHFGFISLTGLRMALVSAGFEMETSGGRPNLATARTYRGHTVEKDGPEVGNEDLYFDEPEYVLATCSDKPIEDAPAHSTVFFSNDDDLWLEHEKIMAWASQLHGEDEELRANLRAAQSELAEAKAAVEEAKLSGELSADDARRNLAVSARLLGRLTGFEVDANPIALVDAMFSLNEQLVTQRSRLAVLEKAERRLEHVERELDSRRAAQELQTRELKREYAEAREQLARELEASRIAQQEQLARHEAQLASHQAAEERLAEEVRETRLRLQELQVHTHKRNEERDRITRNAEERAAALARELNDVQSELQRLRNQAETPENETLILRGVTASGISSAHLRRRSRLVGAHAEIQDQLGRSCAAMRGAISPAEPTRRSFLQRVRRSNGHRRGIPFEPKWVERQLGTGTRVGLAQILNEPHYFKVDPHPLFSAARYLEQHPDIADAGVSPFSHYLEHGWREGRNPHAYFANDWYLQQNPDVLRMGVNPLVHYLEHGWKEGRRPNPVFDPSAYLSRHPDVREANIEPLAHLIMCGLAENREIPFLGLERDWRDLVQDESSKSLMDYLLAKELPLAPVPAPSVEVSGDSWPPQTLNEFWLPQPLRDFMVDCHYEPLVPLYTYLYSVIDAYGDAPEQFVGSKECVRLIARARELAELSGEIDGALDASVIIPVYNNILDTLLCIVSLLETRPNAKFEIIVADDCSTDATTSIISEIGGIVRHLRHAENHGFLGNCNLAAESARGQKIVLLNNDTLLLPSWLDELVAPFDRLESVGLVGSKLISWDGRLQEAGGIFWRDGSAWNFGRGQNATDPEFNYLKDVDYCSGASIAVPAPLWRELGGFDTRYTPAYCEDADLAFRVRKAGYRTLYAPHSEAIHHEGRSHGRDLSSGIKAHQVINQQLFFNEWRTVLENEHDSNGENVLRARDRSRGRRHVLVIDHYVPQFDKDAGSRTMFQFLQALVKDEWSVTFWPENLHYDADYARAIQDIGVEVIYGPRFAGKFSDFLRSRAGLYEAVLLSRPHVAIHFIDDVKILSDARVLYYGHDVHFERMKAQQKIAGTIVPDEVEAMRALEIGICDRCDVVLYPSKDEALLIQSLVAPGVRAQAVPAYCFTEAELQIGESTAAAITPLAGRPAQLLFVGGFAHGPNADGIIWFSREVAPILRRDGLDFEVKIVGSNATAEVWDLESDDTHVLGFVSDQDLRQLYRSASVVIAPLRFGAGVKGKVVEAMANGVPVATTVIGAQGLEAADDFLFIGDTAEEFAAAVRAATDAAAARRKTALALAYIRAHYSPSAMAGVFREVLPAHSSVLEPS